MEFGTMVTNIILLWIRKKSAPDDKKNQKKKNTWVFLDGIISPTLWAKELGLGTVLSNIILLWIPKVGRIPITLTPKKLM